MNRALYIIILCAACFILGFALGKNSASDTEKVTVNTVRETVTDSVFIDRPIPVYIDRHTTDTVIIRITDTVRVNGELSARLPRETRTYTDDSTYTARVSGIEPSLDWLEVYRKTEYVYTETVRTQKPQRWGVSVYAGYGASVHDGDVFMSPSVGVAMTYDLIQWRWKR